MDSFCEQVVKRKVGIKQRAVVLALVVLFAAVEMFSLAVFLLLFDYFWGTTTIVVALIAIFVCLFVNARLSNVEYDYSVVGNILAIDKVINKNKRKKVARIEINSIEDMAKLSESDVPSGRYDRKRNVSAGTGEGDYYCIYHQKEKGKCLLIFSPNQKILDGMKPSLSREMVVKLFYKK